MKIVSSHNDEAWLSVSFVGSAKQVTASFKSFRIEIMYENY